VPDRQACDVWVQRVLDVPLSLSGAGTQPSAQRGEEARDAKQRGIAYPKLLMRWRNAQAKLATALDTIGKDLLEREEVRSDPRFEEVETAVAALPKLVPAFSGDLEDVLDAEINEGRGPQAASIAARAIQVVDQYRAQLAAARQLADLEAFARTDLGKGVALSSELDSALAELRDQLASAA
jgi:hypothetical protein